VSHEFRSPLTRINLAVELIRNVDSPGVSAAITGIEQETERLNGMVGKLLTLSRMEAGQQLVDKEEIELDVSYARWLRTPILKPVIATVA
jgi:two-component system, OmpR family, sensor kinase